MSTENLKGNQIQNTINQSDIGYYIEERLDNYLSPPEARLPVAPQKYYKII